MRKHFFFIIAIFLTGKLFAQELPLNNHSFLNPYVYNPGFAGYENRPAAFFGYRNQWTGIEGAPQTVYLNFHGVAANVIPYGVNIYSDKRSILTTNYALLTVGFRARIEEDDHYLSFALSGGLGFNSVDLSNVNIGNDPVLQAALENSTFLDGNAGLVYHNHGFNMGVSLPSIFNKDPIDTLTFNIGDFSPISNGILMAGYKWEVTPGAFAIEPWVLYYYFENLDGQFEASTTFHIKDVIMVGGSYRMNYGASAFLGINIKDNFKFGYTYEFGVSSVDNFKNNTHELTLGVIFGKSEKEQKTTNFYARRRRMLTTMRSRNQEEDEEKQQQSNNLYKVENDPFEREETPEPEKQQPEQTPQPEPETQQEGNVEDENGEIDLDKFLEGFEEEETAPEDTVKETPPQRAKQPTPEPQEEEEESFEALESFDAPEVDEVTTRDEQGIYIGPKTVTKGDHLLELDKGYYVVVGTFNSYREAEEYSDQLFIQSFYTKFGYISQTTDYYVYIFSSTDNKQECVDTMERLKQIADFREMWVLTVQ